MRQGLRTILLASLLGFASVGAAGAQVAIGLTGGVNSATLTGSDADAIGADAKTGGAGGVYTNLYLGKKFSVEGQLLFAGQGFDVDTVSVTQGYLELPILLKFYVGKLNLFAGPAISWEVSCTADASASIACDTSKNSVWSGIAGAGLQFGKLGVEAHYQSGFSDTFEDIDVSYGVWMLMGRLALLGSR